MENLEFIPLNNETYETISHDSNSKRRPRKKKKPTLSAVAKRAMIYFPSKFSPISLLNKILLDRKVIPKYEIVEIDGASQEPLFRSRVIAVGQVGYGAGRSKKEAKCAAAKNFLEKLAGKILYDKNSKQGDSTINKQIFKTCNKKPENPVGVVQEMCVARKWEPPFYETIRLSGVPHHSQFKSVCFVEGYIETGFGKSKKLSRKNAAYKMWKKLKECPLRFSQSCYEGKVIEKQAG